MCSNLYGPNDNFDLENSHVLPAFKDIGTFINIGTGEELTIKELAETIKRITGYKGELIFNTEKLSPMDSGWKRGL